MKCKNPLGNYGLINPDIFKKEKNIKKIKRISRGSSGLVERHGEKILTEDGKELLKEN